MRQRAETVKGWMAGAWSWLLAAVSLAVVLAAGPVLADEPGPLCKANEGGCQFKMLSASELESERAGQGAGTGVPGDSGWEYAVTLWDELKTSGKRGAPQAPTTSPSQSVSFKINGR